jgi:hypothetical protein
MAGKLMTNLYSIFISPVNIFSQIKGNALGAKLPFLWIVGSSCSVLIWYFLTIDMYRFIEVTVLMSGQELSSSGLNLVLKAELFIRLVSAAATCVALIVAYLVITFYFWIVGEFVAKNRITYTQWLSVVFWGSLPTLLSVFSIAISYALIYPDFAPLQSLDTTSFAKLFSLSDANVYFNILSTVTIGSLWSYSLYCIGFKVLTRCKTFTAIIVCFALGFIQIGLLMLV